MSMFAHNSNISIPTIQTQWGKERYQFVNVPKITKQFNDVYFNFLFFWFGMMRHNGMNNKYQLMISFFFIYKIFFFFMRKIDETKWVSWFCVDSYVVVDEVDCIVSVNSGHWNKFKSESQSQIVLIGGWDLREAKEKNYKHLFSPTEKNK